MKFYNELSKHYHHIFPLSETQIHFLKEQFGKPPKEILDIACGTGMQAIALATAGYGVTAIDQTEGMIQIATEDAESRGISLATVVCGMLEIPKHITGQFDGVFCIGNALVHLSDEKEVEQFIEYVAGLLKPTGTAIIQIINYQRILEQEIKSLPTIENNEAGVAFYRHYTVDGDKILFETKLEANGEILENTVPLLPISWEKVEEIIAQSGLKVDGVFGSFEKERFDPKTSMHWIGILKK